MKLTVLAITAASAAAFAPASEVSRLTAMVTFTRRLFLRSFLTPVPLFLSR